jgi:hypothetical protein
MFKNVKLTKWFIYLTLQYPECTFLCWKLGYFIRGIASEPSLIGKPALACARAKRKPVWSVRPRHGYFFSPPWTSRSAKGHTTCPHAPMDLAWNQNGSLLRLAQGPMPKVQYTGSVSCCGLTCRQAHQLLLALASASFIHQPSSE